MYIDDIKQFAKMKKKIGNPNTSSEDIQTIQRDRLCNTNKENHRIGHKNEGTNYQINIKAEWSEKKKPTHT